MDEVKIHVGLIMLGFDAPSTVQFRLITQYSARNWLNGMIAYKVTGMYDRCSMRVMVF
jgi:hypothetical protein